MAPIGLLHLTASVIALVSGAVVLLRRKGTASHRRIGWIYVISMLVLNVTALAIYRLTRTFGPFHVAAIISVVSVIAGTIPAWRRLPKGKWVARHYFFMAYSYLGLVAAAISEVASRAPAVQSFGGGPTPVFWAVVAAATFAVFAVGIRMINGRAEAIIRPFKPSLGA